MRLRALHSGKLALRTGVLTAVLFLRFPLPWGRRLPRGMAQAVRGSLLATFALMPTVARGEEEDATEPPVEVDAEVTDEENGKPRAPAELPAEWVEIELSGEGTADSYEAETNRDEEASVEDALDSTDPSLLLEPRTMLGQVSRAESGYVVAEKGHTRIVLPTGQVEAQAEMAFLTSRPHLTEEPTRFSDVGLLRLGARRAFSERLELFVHGQMLAKQPATTSEPLWQGAGLGARAEVLDRFALALEGRAGPLLGNAGMWWQAAPGVLFKPEVNHYLRFLVGGGGLLTLLDFSDETERPFWLQEVTAHAEVQAGDRNAVMWVGINYAVPIAHSPRGSRPDPVHGHLDPQVRLGLDVGAAFSLKSSDWDVYAVFSVIDRGDLSRPETTLPILDGGFDQQQIILGVQHRFGADSSPHR